MIRFRALPLLAIPVALLVLAAAPPESDELLRRANAAFLRGDVADADALYAAAAERTADPGLVAFNKAAVLFQKNDFREAELHYIRTLDDRACPPDRAARAWFNRGTCLLRRGGNAAVYRSAIECFDRCLDRNVADEPLNADARHNLELAKLLWAEENRKTAKPVNPNDPPPDVEQPAPQPDARDPMGTNPEPGTKGKDDPGPMAQPTKGPVPKTTPTTTDAKTAGKNANLPTIADDDTAQPLSPEDTRTYLNRIEERLRKERQGMLRTLYGPDRPGIRDW